MLVPAVVLSVFATPGGASEAIALLAVMAVHLGQLLTGTEPVTVYRQRNVLQDQIGHGRGVAALQGTGRQWRRHRNGLGGQNAQQAVLFSGKAWQGVQFLCLDKKSTALGLHRKLLLGFVLVVAVATHHRCWRK